MGKFGFEFVKEGDYIDLLGTKKKPLGEYLSVQ